MSLFCERTPPPPAREPMRLRHALAVSATLLLVALSLIAAAILKATPPTPVPARPGNFVVVADGRCELHLVRTDPHRSRWIKPTRCEPLVPGTDLASSVVAQTAECGELVFGPPSTRSSPAPYACAPCNAPDLLPAGCPFNDYPAGSLLHWERVN